MKNRIMICLLGIICAGFVSCIGRETNKINNIQNKIMITNSIKTKKSYGISFNVYSPYELYINDFLVDFGFRDVSTSTGIEVNPYVLKSGTYRFKMILYPLTSSKDGLLHPDNLQFTNITLGGIDETENYKYIKNYAIPKITKPVPYLVIEDTFTVELPYQLEGWENSRVFAPKTAEDSAAIIRQLAAYYDTLRRELNEGEFDKFFSRYKQSDADQSVYEYRTLQNIHDEDEKFINDRLKKEAVGNMVPIEDYELHIFAQGRVLSLLRKATTKAYGQDNVNLKNSGVLIRVFKDEDGDVGISSIGVKVHMPAGSNQFEIIRK
jgi:hypothetical protein